MKTDKEDRRVCDRCEYFEVSPGGCVETCHALRIDPSMYRTYADDRISGDKQTCKAFRKFINH